MAGPDTWSDRARPGKLQHHSARGTMPRNAGDFTRGSQLITHEFLMWFASARLPFMVWLFTFLLVLSVALALCLHEHEVQMIRKRQNTPTSRCQAAWLMGSFCGERLSAQL